MRNIKNKSHRILYTTSFSHMRGGGQWSLYYLIKHLDKDIFQPIVLCPGKGELTNKMRMVGAEAVYLTLGRIRYLNPLVIWKFAELLKDKKIALIHTDSSTETLYAGIAARILGIPLVWHIRVSEREWFLDRALSVVSTRLILVSEALRARFRWLSKGTKAVVVHNGIDLEEFDSFPHIPSIRKKYNIADDEVLIGCIGRMERRKGQEYLLSAMRHIHRAKLLLLGLEDEEYSNRLKRICADFNIIERVIHIGHRDDIPSVLKEIDIFVLPSLEGEGFPRVILEAMAARRPVVATDDAGNVEAVDDGRTGYIVPRGDIAALAEKISMLVADSRRRKTMGLAGRGRVERLFTIQKNVAKIQDIYREILNNNTP